jgi:hypothetical protein
MERRRASQPSATSWNALWTLLGGIFNSRTVPTAKPLRLGLVYLSGASGDGRWRGFHPALGSRRRSPFQSLQRTGNAPYAARQV